MPYRELQFTVVAEIAEPLSDALMELGALSVSVEDASAGGYDENPLYGEPGLSPEVQAWDVSNVKALFNEEIDLNPDDLLNDLKEAGFSVSYPSETIIADQDWVVLTQSQFEPLQIGKRIWIVPSWHSKPNDPNAICLAVDPGLAFGTGSHPTTRLCLEWLEEFSQQPVNRGKSLMDYGCGSGILAIAGHKLGFGVVFGTDIDPQAIESAKSNARQNNVSVDFQLPDDIDKAIGHQQFDVVIANILANPLQVLAPALIARLKPGGHLVLSGILERQANEVIASYHNAVNLSVYAAHEGWVCLAGSLRTKISGGITPKAPPVGSDKVLARALNQRPQRRSIKKNVFIALATLLIAYPVATIFWRMPILHALAPSIDSGANPISLGAFKILQKVDQALCGWIPCDRKAVADFKAWRFLSADLGMDETKKLGVELPAIQSILQIELQNRLAVPIAVPHLELTLRDADEKIIARILLTPEEWLPKPWQSAHPSFLLTGAPAGELFSLSMPVQLPANAAGYRLRVAYPNQLPTTPS